MSNTVDKQKPWQYETWTPGKTTMSLGQQCLGASVVA